MYNLEAVSYTHLDVYKRQAQTTQMTALHLGGDVPVHASPDEVVPNRGDGLRNTQMASQRGIVIVLEHHWYKLARQPYLRNPSSTFLATEDALGQKIRSITLA